MNKEKIFRQLSLLNKYLKELNSLKNIPFDEFEENSITRAAAERLLQVAIETVQNIGNHIIASRGYRNPKDYADIFRVLEEEKILPHDFSESLQQMAKFRNRLVHIYWDIDIKKVYDIIQNNLEDFERFAQIILEEMVKEN
ncbi:type VII toxin-antitoxin system HepT family RNase toxin [Thermovenabulum sp.]|uniref:type VII toxin-antitoxin system HepT family RNase toxin n=1 Tax=Thermovenabulum sp. TaxID=3100335 RepID=UPI003C7B70D3